MLHYCKALVFGGENKAHFFGFCSVSVHIMNHALSHCRGLVLKKENFFHFFFSDFSVSVQINL